MNLCEHKVYTPGYAACRELIEQQSRLKELGSAIPNNFKLIRDPTVAALLAWTFENNPGLGTTALARAHSAGMRGEP